MTGPTVSRRHWRSTESIPRVIGPSPLLRVERVRLAAAALCRRVLNRPAKLYRPHISPQKLSDLRHRGGAIAEVGIIMLAVPAAAHEIAAHVQGVADAIAIDAGCVVDASMTAQIHDAAEDSARTALLAAIAQDRLTPTKLANLVAACDAQIASTRVLRHAAAAKLERMEARAS